MFACHGIAAYDVWRDAAVELAMSYTEQQLCYGVRTHS
jgi:hypothetical protein